MAIFSRASADMRTLQQRVEDARLTRVRPARGLIQAPPLHRCTLLPDSLLEVVRVLCPRPLLLHHLLLRSVVLEHAIHLLDIVLQLPPLPGSICHLG